MKDFNLLDKIYFLATDGAPVVYSQLNGLLGKLKEHIPYINGVHCAAHRSALGK